MTSLKSLAGLAFAGVVLIVLSVIGDGVLDVLGFLGLLLVAAALIGLTRDPFGVEGVADRHLVLDLFGATSAR